MSETTGDAGPLPIGQVLDGRYRIEDVLGEGGLGVVYRAQHLGLGRPVALKVLHRALGMLEEIDRRFAREAKVLSTLSHPNIVAVSDFGAADGVSYLAMELLEGVTLADELDEGPLDPDRAVRIAEQMLDALAYAHSRGVLHRDLKPGNVFLVAQPDGGLHVKLLDFGLAKMGDPDADGPPKPTLTRLGTILGTPSYMSPEQATSTPADARSDVYSMGIVLYEMLAGRPPFREDNRHDTIRAHLVQDVPAPESFRPGLVLGAELATVIGRSLAKTRESRYAHAGEMGDAIRALPRPAATLSAGAPAPARVEPPSGDEPTVLAGAAGAARPVKRRRGLGCAVASVAAVLVLLAGLATAGVRLYAGMGEPAEARDGATAASDADPATPVDVAGADERAEASAPDEPAVEPRPAAADPLASGVPRALRRAYRKVRRNRDLTRAEIRAVRRYQQDHDTDPRPSLVLGHDHARRQWLSAALERYEIAHRIDPASRGNAWMRDDLVAIAATSSHGRPAAVLLERVYGAEAVPALDAALGRGDLDRDATDRLERLRQRLAAR